MTLPSATEVADVVSAQIGALLSETILSRRFGDIGGQAAALRGMTTAVERLEVQLDGLRDEVRRSSSLLAMFDARLEANDRRAAVTERLATSVDQEVQRLAHRIDEQVTALAANTGGGSELSDGVARLTRKLRQSVAQLDRALLRMGEVSDLAEAEQAEQGAEPHAANQPAASQPAANQPATGSVPAPASGPGGPGASPPANQAPSVRRPCWPRPTRYASPGPWARRPAAEPGAGARTSRGRPRCGLRVVSRESVTRRGPSGAPGGARRRRGCRRRRWCRGCRG